MKLNRVFMILAISAATGFAGCKPKDSAIQAALEEKVKTAADLSGVMVEVKDGIATLTGELQDSASWTKALNLLKDVKGLKSITNNLTVIPPPPPPVSLTTVLDAATQQKVKDGLKDLKGIMVDFVGDKAVLSGEVTKKDRMKLMQILASAKVKSDVSKLINK